MLCKCVLNYNFAHAVTPTSQGTQTPEATCITCHLPQIDGQRHANRTRGIALFLPLFFCVQVPYFRGVSLNVDAQLYLQTIERVVPKCELRKAASFASTENSNFLAWHVSSVFYWVPDMKLRELLLMDPSGLFRGLGYTWFKFQTYLQQQIRSLSYNKIPANCVGEHISQHHRNVNEFDTRH